MAFDYAGKAGTAHALLQKFGRSVTHKYISAEDDGISSEGTFTDNETTQSLIAADFDAGGISLGPADQALVEHGDRVVYISPKDSSGAALDPEPKNDDTIALGSTWYTIVKIIERLAPAGTLVLITVLVRK